MNYKPTIGLEIHIELSTKSKMFCGCKNDPDASEPNVNICPICASQPGSLPVINKAAVKKVIKSALSLNCQIERNNFFERKNYFYPDLPKGYQISQYAVPISKNGYLEIAGREIGIRRVHLEEDTAKLIHPEGKGYSLIDFNRAGIPLMELVTEPDIVSASEAREFVKELQLILRYLGVSEANMEKGEMRVEVNISLQPQKARTRRKELGTKVEIKNLNSVRAVEKAIGYEIKRQSKVLKGRGKVVQETRGWHDKKELTFSQREKEEAHDYRYFPEPDLPPLKLGDDLLKEVEAEIPELPSQKRERFKEQYGLGKKEIELYVSQKDLGEYFEKVVSELQQWLTDRRPDLLKKETEIQHIIKLASNYIATDLQALLKPTQLLPSAKLEQARGREFKEEKFSITPENFAEFLTLLLTEKISSKIAKMVLKEMFKKGKDPSQIIEDRGLKQITDAGELEKIVKEVIEKNPKPVEDYKKGKESALQFLVGKVMAQTKGTANPQKVLEILKKMLG